jgi:hypothetical protein
VARLLALPKRAPRTLVDPTALDDRPRSPARRTVPLKHLKREGESTPFAPSKLRKTVGDSTPLVTAHVDVGGMMEQSRVLAAAAKAASLVMMGPPPPWRDTAKIASPTKFGRSMLNPSSGSSDWEAGARAEWTQAEWKSWSGWQEHDYEKQYSKAREPGQSPSVSNNSIDALEETLDQHGLAEFVKRHNGSVVMTNSYRHAGQLLEAEAHGLSLDEFLQMGGPMEHQPGRGGRPFRMAKLLGTLHADAVSEISAPSQAPMSDCSKLSIRRENANLTYKPVAGTPKQQAISK